MNKTNILYLVSLLLFTFSCQGKNIENKMILKCIIFPTGVTSETYLIKVFENGRFDITYGNKNNGFESDDFESIINSKSIVLKETDLKIIKDLRSQISESKEVEKTYIKKGGWEIIVMTDGEKNHFYHGELNDTPLGKLIDELISISPIKLDIHSWS